MSPNGAVSPQMILDKLADVVSTSLRIDRSRVVETAYLDELGAESLDLLEITMEAEEAFDVLLPQKNILQTAQEVFGAGMIVQDGRLTDIGEALLRQRIPDALWETLPDKPTLADFNRLFLRIQTWVWMIGGLMEHTPRECSACGKGLEKPVAGRGKCTGCGHVYELIPGDELNKRWVEQYHLQGYVRSAPPAPAV